MLEELDDGVLIVEPLIIGGIDLSEELPRPSSLLLSPMPGQAFVGDYNTRESARIIMGLFAEAGDTWRPFRAAELKAPFFFEALKDPRKEIVAGKFVPFGGGYVVEDEGIYAVTWKFVREALGQ